MMVLKTMQSWIIYLGVELQIGLFLHLNVRMEYKMSNIWIGGSQNGRMDWFAQIECTAAEYILR